MRVRPSEVSQRDFHHYLLTAIAPRPICWASTVDAKGNVNLSPFSFFNVFSSDPPVVIFSPAQGANLERKKDTLLNAKETRQVAISVVNFELANQMSLSSTAYNRGVNEFTKSGLTPKSSLHIAPPYVAESPISLECEVIQIIELGKKAGAGNLIICEVKLMHIRDDYLTAEGKIDIESYQPIGRMGGSWYVNTIPKALFKIQKPSSKHGIGIDNLPSSIQKSKVLTGNDLALLGGLPEKPTNIDIEQALDYYVSKNQSGLHQDEMTLHQLIKKCIQQGDFSLALALCFIDEV